ncbi:peptidylprolyl isomerase [Flavobacteriaceae sp. LMIT009]
MKLNVIYCCVALMLSSFFAIAQIGDQDVLFTVDNRPVLAKEFIRVYNKNLDLVKDETQKDIDEYLKLFVNYKLKLAEARALGFHEKASYLRELQGYKKQLAKNYLTDHEVTDALVKEAYQRISSDVKAQHILFRIDPSVTDTTAIYNKLKELKSRLKNEDFSQLQEELHDGSRVFVEDLGYFSGFKMVYEFENVAFITPANEVSDPFRTQFGFHIVKVLDKRESRGEITVGHIMISHNQTDSLIDPESRVNEIYKLLQQGQEFESLAKQFSDDKSSAKKGGKLEPFKGGQLSSQDFEDEAFALENVNDVSEPFPTEFGWHIAKLYNKKPVGSFEELEYELKNMVSKDSRSRLISESMQNRLRTQYQVSVAEGVEAYFTSILNEDFFNRRWKIPVGFERGRDFAKIEDKQLRYGDFVAFLRSQQKATSRGKSFDQIVAEALDAFLNRQVLIYHEENLENVNEDYANILNEYREGLLLFDLMEDKIWNTVKNDTLGIKQYYNDNKNNYKWEPRVEAVVATSSDQKAIKSAKKLMSKGETAESIKEKLNADSQKVIFTSGLMNKDHQALPDGFEFKEGLSKIYQANNAFYIVKVAKVIPETDKTLDEARGQVISDYQVEVENKWVDSLRQKYEVTIDQNILQKVKTHTHQ